MADKPLVFLSWSGKRSQAVARVFHEWIRRFISDCEPWMSSEDIQIGKQWREELNDKLASGRRTAGVFVLTQQNVLRPWVLFEYGRLSGPKDSLCPPLCCDFRPADITGPLGDLQGAVADKDGILNMLKSIDTHLQTEVGDDLLSKLYESQWHQFEPELQGALKTEDDEGDAPPERGLEDMIEEILERVRKLSSESSLSLSRSEFLMEKDFVNKMLRNSFRHASDSGREEDSGKIVSLFANNELSHKLPLWVQDHIFTLRQETGIAVGWARKVTESEYQLGLPDGDDTRIRRPTRFEIVHPESESSSDSSDD